MTRASRFGPLLLLALPLGGIAPVCWAQQAAETPVSAAAAPAPAPGYQRPTGPIDIEAQSADILRDGRAIYRGDVKVSARDFNLSGDELELRQLDNRQFVIVITGAPAHFAHNGGVGKEAPPVDANARRIEYDSRNGVLQLTGEVRLLRGRDRLTTDTLRYDLNERRIQASGGTSGQVRITLDPAALEQDTKDKQP